jgi:hypothetical protein
VIITCSISNRHVDSIASTSDLAYLAHFSKFKLLGLKEFKFTENRGMIYSFIGCCQSTKV